jgi:hypothetical protein
VQNASPDTAQNESSDMAQSTSPDTAQNESSDTTQNAPMDTAHNETRHGAFSLMTVNGQNEARISLYDYRMLRAFPLPRLPKDFHALREQLEKQLADKDYAAAFETAHTLKGMYSNLSLTPLTQPITEMTELLRRRKDTDYSALLQEVMTQFDRLCAL